jgi:5-methylcytosine-specific restriction protein A
MIEQITNWIQGKPSAKRSKEWKTTRHLHLLLHPNCAACGGKKDLVVHHIKPFHIWPRLELEPSNLLTLCEAKGRNCHFTLGHLLNWKSYNPSCAADVAIFRIKVANRPAPGASR